MSLEDELRRELRKVGYANNTEITYVKHYCQFVKFLRRLGGEYVHPAQVGKQEVEVAKQLG